MSTSEQAGHPQIAPARTARPGSLGEHVLQQRTGTTERADRFYAEQVLDRLNTRMRNFVVRQEMFFLATADGYGECDNTLRAGPPGFLHILDDRTLAYPEYRGNGVQASLGNIEENPHVGVLMVDFLRDRIGLHVNGRAKLVADDEMRRAHPGLAADPVPGRRARVWVEIAVEEAYVHCAKHIPHLQKVPPQGPGRAWGTDDFKRKGGDFFGAAAEAPDRGHFEPPPRADAPTWRAEAERALERAERRGSHTRGRVFSGWFSPPDHRAADSGPRNRHADPHGRNADSAERPGNVAERGEAVGGSPSPSPPHVGPPSRMPPTHDRGSSGVPRLPGLEPPGRTTQSEEGAAGARRQ
ncbi:pyridoxamine 5'-phosphate oxidase family protein [Streptomyces sp. H27-H5]|uniref:pyridoxamine 5'-phosphate oxidase family protein n=1 Tax=Streptomyces sp. H27-H5 TaxID=2996460 RepID=UPI00226E9476|nr:pyridoxamine 5'-phosphate oxidase family protein [Streptomyces sp. H27-H5]MCY0960646.1 pyridoxamine 5'-phosphate oxidase family protein [Streptomyces sp. H27-H5]